MALKPTGFAQREESLHDPVAGVGLGSVARPAPVNGVPERSLGDVVGGGNAGDTGEGPQRGLVIEQSLTEPAGLRIAAADAFGEQVVELPAVWGDVLAQSFQIIRVAVGGVQHAEHLAELIGESAPEPARGAWAFSERDEISGDVRETQLTSSVSRNR